MSSEKPSVVNPNLQVVSYKWPLIACCLWSMGILTLLGVLFVAARGGCSLPPPIPLDVRRDAICTALRRGPGCRIRVKETLGATILSDEVDFSVYVGDEFIGSWPIANGVPIDPTLLTKAVVDYALQFEMGNAELQERFRRQLRCRKVAYVDRVMEWSLGATQVIVACAS